jgi:hypothetical protein
MKNNWELYKAYTFHLFPRNVGNPNQITVPDFQTFLYFIQRNNGVNPLYVAHNPYNLQTNTILYNQMVWDVDTDKPGSTLQQALQDIRALSRYFYHYKQLISFSGMGFHFYLKFPPTLLNLDETLRVNIHDFQRKIINELDLHTVNLSCAEPKRIIRIPGTRYVYHDTHNFVVTHKHCIPLNKEIIQQIDLKDILEMSRINDLSQYQHNDNASYYPIDILTTPIKSIQIYSSSTSNSQQDIDFVHMPHVRFMQWLHMIYDDGMLYQLMQTKPHHQTRLLAAIAACNYELTPDVTLSENSVIQLFARLSEIARWSNRNLDIQRAQIHQIYNKNYKFV